MGPFSAPRSSSSNPFENLRAFCRWQRVRGKTVRCCQRADDEELATQTFDCDGCEWRTWVEGLWPENAEAWDIYQRLHQPIVTDLRLAPYVLEALTAEHTPRERAALVTRLGLIRTYGTETQT